MFFFIKWIEVLETGQRPLVTSGCQGIMCVPWMVVVGSCLLSLVDICHKEIDSAENLLAIALITIATK